MKNTFIFILWILIIDSYLYSFGGRLPGSKKVIKVYKEDDPNRIMGFIKFDNMTGMEDVEYFRTDIPKVLYTYFHNKDRTVRVSRNDLKPKWKNQLNYDKRVYNYYIEDTISTSAKTPKEVEEDKKKEEESEGNKDDFISEDKKKEQEKNDDEIVFDSNKKYRKNPQTLSQWMEEKIKDDEKHIYKVTEGDDKKKNKKITFYFPNKDYIYIDSRNSNFNPKYLINNKKIQEFIINNYDQDTKRFEKVIFRESNGFKRNFKVMNTIMNIKNTKLSEIVDELQNKKIDYAIYGQIVKAKKLQSSDDIVQSILGGVSLKIYLIRVNNKQIELIYDKIVNPFNTYNELSSIPSVVLASIENKPMIKNIVFDDNLGGSYIYLDGIYMGKTPLRIKTYPKGDYQLKIWNQDIQIDYESLAQNKNVIVEQDKFNKDKRVYLKIDKPYQNTKVFFKVKKKETRGVVEITVKGSPESTNLYVDSQLTSIFQEKTKLTMPMGNYFFSFNNDPKYQVVRLIAPVHENMITKIKINFQEIEEIPKWKQNLFNHERNYKIFGILSGIIGVTTVGVWIHTKDILYKQQELEKQNQTQSNYYNSLTKQNSDANITYFVLLGTTLLFAILSVATKIALVKQDEYKFGLPDVKNDLYELEYIPINKKKEKRIVK